MQHRLNPYKKGHREWAVQLEAQEVESRLASQRAARWEDAAGIVKGKVGRLPFCTMCHSAASDVQFLQMTHFHVRTLSMSVPISNSLCQKGLWPYPSSQCLTAYNHRVRCRFRFW